MCSDVSDIFHSAHAPPPHTLTQNPKAFAYTPKGNARTFERGWKHTAGRKHVMSRDTPTHQRHTPSRSAGCDIKATDVGQASLNEQDITSMYQLYCNP